MDRNTDRWIRSDEARTKFRSLLDLVTQDDAHVYVLRYDTPAAVIVPVEWYEHQRAALAAFAEAGMDGDVPVSAREVRNRVVTLAALLDGMRKYIHPEIPESTFADYWKKINEQVLQLAGLLPENAEESP
jgi:hypothetical protein